MRLARLLRIVTTAGRHGLDEFLVGPGAAPIRLLMRSAFFWADRGRPRGERLREAFQELGPIFVKFGQVLSIRPDLIPRDIADELAKLQDRVPPFSAADVEATLIRAYAKPHGEVFRAFDLRPVASASVAQVHFAELPDGRDVAVKILRPGIRATIEKDVALLQVLGSLVERFVPQGPRLRPREVVREFENTIYDELDLVREAASMSTMRRNFEGSPILYVPEVHWPWCTREVMVMERIDAIPVNDVAAIRAAGLDPAALGRSGVEIFFTQVFRDGFFHADMHPGHIFVARDGRYCGIDYGIMGMLSEADKNYLALNFMAFFRRDYKAVAQAHVDAGWIPPGTRLEEFEAAIRTVCEPIFDKPLKEIYFGKLLMRLFEVSRRFQMDVQPQLVLLYKTLLQVEGLGRALNPDLDLRSAAQPILTKWVNEQVGPKGLWRKLRREVPQWTKVIPEIPRLVHRVLDEDVPKRLEEAIYALERAQRRQARVLTVIAVILAALGALLLLG